MVYQTMPKNMELTVKPWGFNLTNGYGTDYSWHTMVLSGIWAMICYDGYDPQVATKSGK